MHEYEMKCSSKTQVLNPIFPKKKIDFNNLPFFCLATKQFYIKLKVFFFFKLGWLDHKHTQLYVQSLAKSNLCCVCNIYHEYINIETKPNDQF